MLQESLMKSNELTRLFASSVAQQHPRVPSEPLLSEFFPTSFTSSAGPAILLEHLERGQTRYPSRCHVIQPCLRYWDIPHVGDDTHLSFFEMAACASFEADGRTATLSEVARFLTEECRVGRERLWATYFRGGSVADSAVFSPDDEALQFWTRFGLQESHLVAVDGREGFVANQTEPVGGYRTELYVQVERESPPCATCLPASCTCGRFIELATSVAYEYSVAHASDRFTILPLRSQKMFAAGFGVERLESILAGHGVVHRTARMHRLVEVAADISGKRFTNQSAVKLCDALRALLFLYAGGADRLSGKVNKSRRWVLNKWVSVCRDIAPEPSWLEGVMAEVAKLHADEHPELTPEVTALVKASLVEKSLEVAH